ncbi:ABC transporter ATP-binding protein [Blastopirellula marina]|uniref:ABC transporter ATP-binding protein n=1 Tax=Blastopirellula marina TaxID=124 RepID=A0A2S8FX21_9BACT|nr:MULTISPECIES: ABC-F family ATP-binding cassette domain-containing protein [Pirellulaceae]PQO36732.1 ABC transporter ATP-binding protein [Blastopirellula marina]RCS53447.1 ABC transporter ATP-binding protein [Bremerella cremea]
MPPVINIQNATKRFGHKVLLDGATASITDDHKVGLVGRNGAGKSTLCRAILGDEELEKGEVVLHPKTRLGYLRQHDPFLEGETVVGFLMRDSDQPDWKCGEVAARFEIKGAMLDAPVHNLSGGWQTRVKLTALLLHDPTFLILDEPTNFLDIRTQMLLERFLKSYKGGYLIVSHDRGFLKQTCNETLELSRGKLTLYPGSIEDYIEYRDERKLHDERVNAATKAKAKQLQRFIDKNRAGANTAAQAKNKQKQLNRLEYIEIEADEASAYIRVPQVDVKKGTAVRCEGLSIGYPDRVIADGITLDIEHGARAAVVGDNGQGKTTFLRTLVGSLAPKAGEVKWGHNTDIGIYAQHVYSTLPANDTVEEYLLGVRDPSINHQQVLAVAGSFLFRGDDVQKKVKVLSGGERARLCLAGLLLGKYNILILDEPGNHLDVETVDSLCEALDDYNGTVIFTSHDRYFVRRIATQIIEVSSGKVTHIPSDYEHYLYRLSQEIEQEDGNQIAANVALEGRDADLAKEERKQRNKDARAARKELNKLESKIAKLDDERKDLNRKLMEITDAAEAQKVHARFTTVADEIAELEGKWLEFQELLEDFDDG